MTPNPTPPPVDGNDCRYLSLVRELAAATQRDCTPDCDTHRQDAAWHINALLGNNDLLLKLLAVAAKFDKQPPPGLDELKQSFWRLEARLPSLLDGSSANPSSDSSSTEQENQ